MTNANGDLFGLGLPQRVIAIDANNKRVLTRNWWEEKLKIVDLKEADPNCCAITLPLGFENQWLLCPHWPRVSPRISMYAACFWATGELRLQDTREELMRIVSIVTESPLPAQAWRDLFSWYKLSPQSLAELKNRFL